MSKTQRTFFICGGSEEGYRWRVQLSISSKMKSFSGDFVTLGGIIEKEKIKTRQNDQKFFRRACGMAYMDKYEIDHNWENGGTVTLKTPKEHRNCRSKPNQYDWREEEDWLDEK